MTLMFLSINKTIRRVVTLAVLLAADVCPMLGQTAWTESLAGSWKFVASPFDGGSEEIAFTATPAADGKSLLCHADRFIAKTSEPYAADWTLAVEEADGKVRLGWKLDADRPVTEREYQESASMYVMGGSDADGSHHYIYLLSEDIETWQLEPMTLWSDWQSSSATTFTLSKTQQIYAVVSQHQPYNGSIGYIEIWASGKLQKQSGESSIQSLVKDQEPSANSHLFNLQGVRLSQLQKGLNIVNGRKVVVK